MKSIKFRRCTWLDTKLNAPVYGIEVFKDNVWYNAYDGTNCLFYTAAERDVKLKEMRRLEKQKTKLSNSMDEAISSGLFNELKERADADYSEGKILDKL